MASSDVLVPVSASGRGILSDYRYVSEFHAHTHPASICSEVSPADAVKNLAAIGVDSVIITNHFSNHMPHFGDKSAAIAHYLDDYDRAAEAGDRIGMTVILGCEIRFTEHCNDYLVFGIDRDFFPWAYDYIARGFEAFSRDFRGPGRLLFQAHPFRDNMVRADPALLDGVEAWNLHPHHNNRTASAVRFAHDNGLLVSAGTDYHHVGHEGNALTLSRTPVRSQADAVALLTSRDFLVKTSDALILPFGDLTKEASHE